MADYVSCTIKELHASQQVEAARAAITLNPANAPVVPHGEVIEPARLAVLTGKRWPSTGVKLTVGFLDSAPLDLQKRILEHFNAWGKHCNAVFVLTGSDPQVRISRIADGYWSYLGTDILHIRPGEATMNLQGFTMNTPESEFKRVVRHEVGHTLGFPHEQQLPEIVADLDVAKTIAWGRAKLGWDEATVRSQILTPLPPNSFRMTAHADKNGIMCYALPASITKSGNPIPGGLDIDEIDGQFAGQIYPLVVNPPPPPPPGPGTCDCAQAVLAFVRAFNAARPRGRNGAMMSQPITNATTFTDAEKQAMAALGGNLCSGLGTLPWQKIIAALLAACPQQQAAGGGVCSILAALLPLFCPPPS